MKGIKIFLILAGVLLYSSWTVLLAQTVQLSEGWSLKGSSCFMDVSNFDKDSILIMWKYKDGGWLAWSPNNSTMDVINQYNIPSFSSIDPHEGFWIKASSPVEVEFCSLSGTNNTSSETRNSVLKNMLMDNVPDFLVNTNGTKVTLVGDEDITCDFIYDNSTYTITLKNCTDPKYNGQMVIDWSNLQFVGQDNSTQKIVWADDNSLCVNSDFYDGEYNTSCIIANKSNYSDDDILSLITHGSKIAMSYHEDKDNWYPDVYITFNDNGTVTYRNGDGELIESCNYSVQNGQITIICDNKQINAYIINNFVTGDPVTGEALNSTLVNLETYVDGNYVGNGIKMWKQVPSSEVTDMMARFLNTPTEENYTNLLNVIDSLPEGKKTHLWRATATLLKLYQDNQNIFNNLGIDLSSDMTNLKMEDVVFNLLHLANYDQQLKAVLNDLSSKLDTVLSDLQQAEGVNTSINTVGFTTIYFDNLDVKIMEIITQMAKAMCIYLTSIDYNVSTWAVSDGDNGTIDIRDLIKNGEEVTDAQFLEFMSNNQNLFTYMDTSKLPTVRQTFQSAVDMYDGILKNLSEEDLANRARLSHAFDIENNEIAVMFQKVLDSFKSAIDNPDIDLKGYIYEYVGETTVLADDGNYYIQELYNAGVRYLKPADVNMTLYHLAYGEKSPRDVVYAALNADMNHTEYEPYVLDTSKGENGIEIIAQNVPEVDWSEPLSTYTIPVADISIDSNANDWSNIPVFRSLGNTYLKIARSSDNQYIYLYAFNTNPQSQWWSCSIDESTDGYLYSDASLSIGYSNGYIDAYYSSSDNYENIPEQDMASISDSGGISGVELKFPHPEVFLEQGAINGYYIDDMSSWYYDKVKLLPEISNQ